MRWLLLLPILCSASPLQEAHAAYLRGEAATTVVEAETAFNEALSHYLSVTGTSAGLSYNLGNTYLQLGEPATALYHYSRAQMLAPRDRRIRAHQRLAARRLGVAAPRRWFSPADCNLLIAILGVLALLRIRFSYVPLILTAVLLYSSYLANPQAILLKSAMVRTAPSVEAAACGGPLPAGTCVRVRGQTGEWVKIKSGFVLADSLGIL